MVGREHLPRDHVDAHVLGLQGRLGSGDDTVWTDFNRQRTAGELPDLSFFAGDGIDPVINQVVGVEGRIGAHLAHHALVVAVGQWRPRASREILHRQHGLQVAVVEPEIQMQPGEGVDRFLGNRAFQLGEQARPGLGIFELQRRHATRCGRHGRREH